MPERVYDLTEYEIKFYDVIYMTKGWDEKHITALKVFRTRQVIRMLEQEGVLLPLMK